MKTTITIILIIFSSIIGYSQTNEFAPNDAEWYYSFMDDGAMVSGYYKFTIIGDSMIAGHNCKILKIYSDIYDSFSGNYYSGNVGYEYIYSDSNIVYNYRYNQFYVLYNYNAQQGDTWIVAGDSNTYQGSNQDTTSTIYVDSISTELVNGFQLKVLYVKSLEPYEWNFSGRIIEKIGCVGYLLPLYYGITGQNQYGPLRCYFDGNFGYYNTNIAPDCDFLTNNAQTYYPLVETNKIWSVGEVTGVWGPYLEHGSSYLYWFNNDTLIEGINYYKIYRTHDTTLNSFTIIGYVGEDTNKKVYFKPSINEQERLLYDFSLNINDTLNYIIGDSLWSDTCKQLLYNIDSILVDNKYRKQFHFNPINADSDDIWIEGIGSLKGIIHPYQCYVGLYTELLCLTENDTLKYINTTYNTCYIDPLGINIKNNSKIELLNYNNSIEIQLFEYNEYYLFKMYDVLGNVVISISSNQSIKIPLDNYNIKQGMYLYTLSTNKDVIKRNKIIYIK